MYHLLVSLLAILSMSASVTAQDLVTDMPANLDKARNRNVPLTIHLPTQKTAQPLVLVSHGGAGSRDGLFALSSEIARQGYVVICLEHVTSNLQDIRRRMMTKRLNFKNALIDCGKDSTPRKNRPLDVRFAIDLAESLNRDDPRFKGRIDLSQIAILGHSYGAYTTMVCCGAKPVGIEDDLTEPRIKLGIALSPQAGNGNFFDQDSFSEVSVPFIGISGTKDTTHFITSVDQRQDFFKLMPEGNKHLVWFHDAHHFSFSDPTGSKRRTLFPPDKDTTNALKIIIPPLLNTYLRGAPPISPATRQEIIDKCLSGTIHKINWQTN